MFPHSQPQERVCRNWITPTFPSKPSKQSTYLAASILAQTRSLVVIPGEFPYGKTEGHYASTLIHLVDEEQQSYHDATTEYNSIFPYEKITEEATRYRHIRSLKRLLEKYGAKPIDQIGPLRETVQNRGKARKHGLDRASSGSQTASPQVESNGFGSSMSGTMPPAREASVAQQGTQTTATSSPVQIQQRAPADIHAFDKVCIVVWMIVEHMDILAVRLRLHRERGWNLSLAEIEEYYYQTLDRAHGTEGMDTGFRQYAHIQHHGSVSN